jgi:hypothetical protein
MKYLYPLVWVLELRLVNLYSNLKMKGNIGKFVDRKKVPPKNEQTTLAT